MFTKMPPDISFSEKIEDYYVLDLLGTGGFAHVYRAIHLPNNVAVAIKMIDKNMLLAKKMTDRVKQEVTIHSRLEHPSILYLYTFFEDEKYIYLILELCHKGDLQSFLAKKGGPLSEELAAQFLMQVVNGLLYLHKYNIIHRDISLKNLLLTSDNQVKIADFGLATQLSDKNHITMCGTPNYISPEVATGSPHGLKTDIWSLGCMLYTLLVNKPPFEAETVKCTLTKVVTESYKNPSSLSPNARDLINKLLKKSVEDRIGLQDILEHPFITSLKKYKSDRYGSISSGADSGLGRTLSSYEKNHFHSCLEDRTSSSISHGYNHQASVKSEPGLSNFKKIHPFLHTNRYSSKDDNSVLRGIVRNHRRITPLMEETNWHESNDTSKKDVQKCQNKNTEKVKEANIQKLKNEMAPLNTERLPPSRHRANNNMCTILKNGEVCVEFIKKLHNIEKVDKVCRVSGDGLHITIYNLSVPQPISIEPPPVPENGANVYSFESLPSRYYSTYIRASRYVKLIRAKTPKITLYTNESKCFYMENGPNPDCKIFFHDGVEVSQVSGNIKLENKEDGRVYSENDVPVRLEKYIEHYKKCYEECKMRECGINTLEQSMNLSFYPLTIGQKPSLALRDAHGQGKENVTQNTCSPIMMSTLHGSSSYSSTIASQKKSNSENELSSTNMNKKSILGIGTATRHSNDVIEIAYIDGSVLTLKPDRIMNYKVNGKRMEYNLAKVKNLPPDLRDKFEQLPLVFQQLQTK